MRLEPLDSDAHGRPLYAAAHGDGADPRLWDYMSVGPFDEQGFGEYLAASAACEDPLFFAVVATEAQDGGGRAHGIASYMRIERAHGVIEIGNIWFGPGLQRTRAATEAIFLLADNAFALGYRRLEWKCDSRNERSRRAALRFGFTFEGLFRNHMIIKGANRDTAWYSITDEEWPRLRAAFEAWLDDSNFDAEGRQLRSLSTLTSAPA